MSIGYIIVAMFVLLSLSLMVWLREFEPSEELSAWLDLAFGLVCCVAIILILFVLTGYLLWGYPFIQYSIDMMRGLL